MKKLLLYILMIVCGQDIAWAQSQWSTVNMDRVREKRHHGGINGVLIPSWYEQTEAVLAQGAGQYAYRFLFPDTNALFLLPENAGVRASSINIAGLGNVFDPRSTLYTKHPFGQMSRWNDYILDSLWLFYQYHRFNIDTALVDTLVVHVFGKPSILRGFENEYAAAVSYDAKLMGVGGSLVKEYKILLKEGMNDPEGSEVTIPVRYNVKGGVIGENWVGAALSFIPGNRYYKTEKPFDTVADFSNLNIRKSGYVNTLRILCLEDNDKFVEDRDSIPPLDLFGFRVLNHGIIAQKEQRYKLPVGSGTIVDYYYPSFYPAYNLLPVIDMHIQAENLSVKKRTENLFFYDENLSQVTIDLAEEISICDLAGKEMAKGLGKVSTSGLTTGFYVVLCYGRGSTLIYIK